MNVTRSELTTERIIGAAIEELDDGGLDTLTMGRVGARLGVAAITLYRHVPNREALLDAVSATLITGVRLEVPPATRWTDALWLFGKAYRRMLLTHPAAVPLIATRPVDPEAYRTVTAQVLRSLADAGVDQGMAEIAVRSIAVFVTGHALAHLSAAQGRPSDSLYFNAWFDAGLRAMVTGFEQEASP